MTLTDRICGTDSMIDISLIPVFGTSQVDSFYNLLLDGVYKLSSSSCASYYHICDTPQPLPDISSGVLRSRPKTLLQSPKDAHDRHFKREFFDRAARFLARFVDRRSAFLQDFSSHEPNRSLNFTVALLLQRQRSHSFRTLQERRNKDGSARQEKQKYAAKTEKVRTLQNCETFAGKGLRAFLPVRTAISWRVLAYRFNLKNSAQIERESWRSTGCKGRSFWRWIKPFPDIPIVLPEDAAFPQEGGAS